MRLSVDKEDRAYCPSKMLMCYNCRIFFNGEELQGVITADEELGYVVRYKLDKQGRFVTPEPGTDTVPKETLHGKVEIKVMDDES